MVVVWVLSYWRCGSWSRSDEKWVLPGSGMQELHITDRSWLVFRGRLEIVRSSSLRAVIPAGSSAAGPEKHVSRYLWTPVSTGRVRSWDDRFHFTRWNEWRIGNSGWFTTTGGGVTSRVMSMPLWLPLVVSGTPCWIGLAHSAKSRRRRVRGLCTSCGYDRRGIAAQAHCPECGAAARS